MRACVCVYVCVCVCVCAIPLHRDVYLFICHTLVQLRAVLGDLSKARTAVVLSYLLCTKRLTEVCVCVCVCVYVCVCGLSASCMCML